MKQVNMTQCKDKNQLKKSKLATSAFDAWLSRGLHDLFDEIANEPIPEKLLKLINEDGKS